MSIPAVSATSARANLFNLIKEVAADHTVTRITSNAGDAILMSAEDYESWQETVYLLRSPANARRLMEAVARDKAGEAGITKTLEELESLGADAAGDE